MEQIQPTFSFIRRHKNWSYHNALFRYLDSPSGQMRETQRYNELSEMLSKGKYKKL